jgi:hypothetical protein
MATPKKSESKDPSRSAVPREAHPRDRGVVALPRAWLIGGLAVLTLPWLVVCAIYFRAPHTLADDAPDSPAAADSRSAKPGPWGRLTVTPIIVSPPLEYVAADWGRPEGPYQWYFPGTSPQLLHAFLSSSGLTADQIARLESTGEQKAGIAGLTVTPDLELVRSLDPQVRARLYLQLAKSSLNGDQANSFRFFGTSSEEWLRGSLIAPSTRQLIEPLIFRDGDIMHFADAEIAHAKIADKQELQRLAKTLLRQPTMLVRLSVDRTSQIPELTQYWGRGGRATDIRPLLEWGAGAGAGGEIVIVDLRPSFARIRLFR